MSRSKILWFTLLTLALATVVSAQQHRPLSPRGKASTEVGGHWVKMKNGESTYKNGKWIDIDYGRPIRRGRTDLWGEGANYGKGVYAGASIWRAGANQTTRIKTEVPLEINGKRVAPGEYSLFIDLKPGHWTLVVSTQPYQEKFNPKDKGATWGAYGYNSKFDVVRAPMSLVTSPYSIDELTIGFLDMSNVGGKLAIAWDKQVAMVDFKVVK